VTAKGLDITNFEIEGESDGSVKVTCWCKCRTPEDIDAVIAWLQLSKTVMNQWGEIRRIKEQDDG
jgi:hypothetical protein